jgi:hypothetical protein
MEKTKTLAINIDFYDQIRPVRKSNIGFHIRPSCKQTILHLKQGFISHKMGIKSAYVSLKKTISLLHYN